MARSTKTDSGQMIRRCNPMEIDCGDLIDAETRETLRPATVKEAVAGLYAQRREGKFCGVISTTYCGSPVLATVRRPAGVKLTEYRLWLSLKLRGEREMIRVHVVSTPPRPITRKRQIIPLGDPNHYVFAVAPKCPICGSRKTGIYKKGEENEDGSLIRYTHCKDCKARFVTVWE